MKTLIQITIALSLLVHTMSYGQTEQTLAATNKQDTTLKKTSKESKSDMSSFHMFIGEYMLEEAGFVLEIIAENGKMYLVTEFSKDILIPKNETTLHELTRGVDLELIENNKDALKFTQNGYETTIKRVNSETEK